MKLTILVCAITERFELAKDLVQKLEYQIDGGDVQVMLVMDNRKTTIGEKRNMAKDLVTADYWCQIDDDDNVSDNFVSDILEVIDSGIAYDVITYNSFVTLSMDQQTITGIVESKLGNEAQQFVEGGITLRPPAQFNTWRTSLVKSAKFDNTFASSEDFAFSDEACKLAKLTYHIDKVLHYYNYSNLNSRAYVR